MRNLGLSLPFDNVANLIGARIAVAAQLETEGPIGRHYSPSDNGSVLLNHLFRLRTEENEEVE